MYRHGTAASQGGKTFKAYGKRATNTARLLGASAPRTSDESNKSSTTGRAQVNKRRTQIVSSSSDSSTSSSEESDGNEVEVLARSKAKPAPSRPRRVSMADSDSSDSSSSSTSSEDHSDDDLELVQSSIKRKSSTAKAHPARAGSKESHRAALDDLKSRRRTQARAAQPPRSPPRPPVRTPNGIYSSSSSLLSHKARRTVVHVDSDSDEVVLAPPRRRHHPVTQMSTKRTIIAPSSSSSSSSAKSFSSARSSLSVKSGSASTTTALAKAGGGGGGGGGGATQTRRPPLHDRSNSTTQTPRAMLPASPPPPKTTTKASAQRATGVNFVIEVEAPKKRLSSSAREAPPRPATPPMSPAPAAGPLQELLAFCSQATALPFDVFVASPPAALRVESENARWSKIGEASFSEVFALSSSSSSAPSSSSDGGGSSSSSSSTVVKIIPLMTASPFTDVAESDGEQYSPFLSDPGAVLRELKISDRLGGAGAQEKLGDGFVTFKGAYIVEGSYPPALLEQWDVYSSAGRGDGEQVRPDVLPASQAYAVVCLENAGEDLEHFRLATWSEALEVLRQVTSALAAAENECAFEHRDLHWGNILLQRSQRQRVATSLEEQLESLSLDSAEGSPPGIKATVIDFTLSRLEADGSVVFDAFEDDELFEGEGDLQYDQYRRMRGHVQGDWQGFHPHTNVMWLHYLCHKLLTAKKLRKPTLATLEGPTTPMRTRPSRRRGAAFASPARKAPRSEAQPSLSAAQLAAESRAYAVLASLEHDLAASFNSKRKPAQKWASATTVLEEVQARSERA